MPSLVLGTAGHIDHGKSSLVKALTGTDPDRLAEEKERGITIELGFARLELPSGRTMGVVDVPGHEKFVRQMVAGATGIDVVMLVVAADDGVMPQTREHLAIIDLLGIDRGVVALTKSDLADPDWLAMVTEDIEQLLKGTSIEGARIVAVSSRTGQGLDELRGALDEVAEEAPSRQAALPMRLPVDRVFTIAGAGTVVTGTLWSGTAARDDDVEIYPGGRRGRVRGVQVHSDSVDRAAAGQRVAINIAGVDLDDISRGDIIAAPGSLTVTDRIDVRLTYLGFPDDAKSFRSGSRVHVHHGTREVLGRALLMDAEELTPGGHAFAQIRLEEPLAPRYGDRFIIRSYSPVYTIGGGVVLDVSPPRRTVLRAHELELLTALERHDVASATTGLLAARQAPMSSAQVASVLGVDRALVADALNKAGLERIKLVSETYYLTREALDRILGLAEDQMLEYHAADPKATGLAVSALRDRVDRRMDPKVFDAILAHPQAASWAVTEQGRVRHARAAVSALAEQSEASDALVPLLRSQGLAPASPAELAATLGKDQAVVRKALTALTLDGTLVRTGSEMHFHAEAIQRARVAIAEFISARGSASAADLRELLGVSRKYLIPLLEYFDAQGFTRRDGDMRVLKRG